MGNYGNDTHVGYQVPPKDIADLINPSLTPGVSLDPSGK